MQAIGNFDTTIAAAAEVDLIVGTRASEGAAGIVVSIAVCSWACRFEQLGVSGWRTLGGRTISISTTVLWCSKSCTCTLACHHIPRTQHLIIQQMLLIIPTCKTPTKNPENP
jgi:hypothetical protein